MAGVQTLGISYKAPQQSIPALIGGERDFLIQDAANALRQVQAGTLKARRSSLNERRGGPRS